MGQREVLCSAFIYRETSSYRHMVHTTNELSQEFAEATISGHTLDVALILRYMELTGAINKRCGIV